MSLSLPSLSLPLSSRTQFVFFSASSAVPAEARVPILHWGAELRGSLASLQKQRTAFGIHTVLLWHQPRVMLLSEPSSCCKVQHGDEQAEQRVSPKNPGKAFPLLNPARISPMGSMKPFVSTFWVKCWSSIWVPLKLIELLPEQWPTTTALNSAAAVTFLCNKDTCIFCKS